MHAEPHVDDDKDIQVIAKLALEMSGAMSVEQYSSGLEALEKLHNSSPDLILLDAMMPVMDGQETLQKIRLTPGFETIPVVFMTAKVESAAIEAMIRNGASAVITKPFDPMTLPAQVEKIWKAHHQLSEQAEQTGIAAQ